MLDEALALGMLRSERRDEDEGDVALPQDVAGFVSRLRFQAGIGDHIEAKGVAIEVGRLPGVADEKADVIDAPQGHGVKGHSMISVV